MKNSIPTFDTMRPCSAVIDDEATVASLLDRIHNGETAEHYCLTDQDGRIQGFVAIQDVLEFLVPYMLFTDADALEELLVTVGSLPLKMLAKDSFQAVSLHQDLSSIVQHLFTTELSDISSIDNRQQVAANILCTWLLQKLPRRGREKFYAVS